MQGKESSEQNTGSNSTAGIDVCKNWLDAHVLPGGHAMRFANDRRGHRQLIRWLAQWRASLVVMEATGKWHRQIHRALHIAGFKVAVVNPLRARLFAEGAGVLAKTDRIDARVLAFLGASLSPAARPPAPECMEVLQELVAGRDSAVKEQTALQNQLAAAEANFLRRQLKARIQRIAVDISKLEIEIERLIRSDETIARRYAILRSIPGIGPVGAATLIANMAELGDCSAKQIAMLAGLAPIADQSGPRDGQRSIRGGRIPVRRVLYICALSAKRCNAAMAAFYHRLTQAGRPHKVAIIAVARKLIVLANTLITENRLWQTQPPIPA